MELLQAGMGVARFNFSHGSHEYHSETLANLREACRITGQLCGVLLDTKGPEIRTGKLKGGGPVTYTEVPKCAVMSTLSGLNGIAHMRSSSVGLSFDRCQQGSNVTITTDYTKEGDERTIAISYEQAPNMLRRGDTVLVADGSLMLEVGLKTATLNFLYRQPNASN